MAPRLLIKTRVVALRDEARDVRSFVLEPVHRDAFPSWTAGAHTVLRLPDGQSRAYSLCGDPADGRRWRIAVLREPGGRGGSTLLHDTIGVGDTLWASHPQDGFALDPDGRRHLLIAGGIGITPLLAMLRTLPADQEAELRYCVAAEERAAFLEELAALDGRVTVRLHRGDRGERLDVADLLADLPADVRVACCGPQRLMDAVREGSAGWADPSRVRFESFGAQRARGPLGEPFDVFLTLSGREVHVPEDETLLEAVRAAGIPVDSACESGLCRTCKVELIDGDAIHNDEILTGWERAVAILPCVSRGRGRLRLQL